MTETGYFRKESRATFDPLRGKRPLLRELDLELTERCDNRCLHCFINRPEHDPEAEAREMGTEFVRDLLRQAAALGCTAVRITGGEPLLRPDFSKIYLAARRLGMQVLLYTNARRITRELAELFERVPPGRPLEVSVYGMNARSYDAVAGASGAYEEFRAGIELLREIGVPFVVKQALLPQNRSEIEEFEAWAATIPGMEHRPVYAMNFDLRGRRDDPAKSRRIAALRLTPEETLTMLRRDSAYVTGLREFCQKFLGPQGAGLFSCGAGHGVCVDSYGYAQMCLPLRHPETVFDLHTGTLDLALKEFFPRIRKWKAENPEYLRHCAVCFLKGLCEQCPAKSWMEHGTLDTPVEYLCEVAHVQARHIGLLGEHEYGWQIRNWRERVERLSSTT